MSTRLEMSDALYVTDRLQFSMQKNLHINQINHNTKNTSWVAR